MEITGLQGRVAVVTGAGRMRSIGRPSWARKSSYYVGKKVGKNMVLHRGIETASTASGRMLPE